MLCVPPPPVLQFREITLFYRHFEKKILFKNEIVYYLSGDRISVTFRRLVETPG